MQCMSNGTTFGAAVKEARGTRISQARLAALIGASPATIYRIERGERPSPRVESALRRWCHVDLPPVDRIQRAA